MANGGHWQNLFITKHSVPTNHSLTASPTNLLGFIARCPEENQFEHMMGSRTMVACVLDEYDNPVYNTNLRVRYIFNLDGVPYDDSNLDQLNTPQKIQLLSNIDRVPNLVCRFVIDPYHWSEMHHELKIELQVDYRWADNNQLQLRFIQEPVPVVNQQGPTSLWYNLGAVTVRSQEYVRRKITIPVAGMGAFEAMMEDENQHMLGRFRSYRCVRASYIYTPSHVLRGVEFQKYDTGDSDSIMIHFEQIQECFGRTTPLQFWFRWRGYTIEFAVQRPGELNIDRITQLQAYLIEDTDVADDSGEE